MNETKQSVPCRESRGSLRRLAAAVVAGVLACCAFDARALTEVVDGVEWTYTVSDGKATVGDYSSSSRAVPTSTSGVLTIPSALGGCPVVSIAAYAFSGCRGLVSVAIPEGVTNIGYAAFTRCDGLMSVVIPEGVSNISTWLFSECSNLASVTIPTSVTSIGTYAFSGCSGLKSVEIPSSVTNIGEEAFSSCSGLTSVTIPSGVRSIGSRAFYLCKVLESVTIPSGVERIDGGVFSGCSGLKSVTISEGVTSIGDDAFANCSGLSSVTIPLGVTSIGASAFSGCSGLTSVMIPSSVMSIGSSAFSGCSGLTSVVIPEGVTDIMDRTFSGCGALESIVIPSSAKGIGDSAFSRCRGLREVKMSEGVERIGYKAFEQCEGLVSVTIPSSVTTVGGFAFYYCSGLKSAEMLPGVTSIGANAFQYCSSLVSVTIPSSVKNIGANAFQGCGALESAAMQEGLTSIEEHAFSGCSSLVSMEIPSSVTNFGKGAFAGCRSLLSVKIPSGVTSIEERAFSGCSGLVSAEIPSGVTSIGMEAFNNCSGLKSMTIPKGVTSIGYAAFSGCSGLTSLTISEGVTSIDWAAFSNCSGLTSLTIPEGVTSIGGGAFGGCSSLETVLIPPSVEDVGRNAFEYCSRLVSVTIPPGVTSIGENLFFNCHGLNEIVAVGVRCELVERMLQDFSKTRRLNVLVSVADFLEILLWTQANAYAQITVEVGDVDLEGVVMHMNERIEQPEAWANDSVHLVIGDCRVESNGRLEIQAGAVVRIDPCACLRAEAGGEVLAEGVVFTTCDDTRSDVRGAYEILDRYREMRPFISWSGDEQAADRCHGILYGVGCGRLAENTTWKSGEVYVVGGTLTVPNGIGLTIEKGAVVKFLPRAKLEIETGGTCVAKGAIFTHVNDDTAGGDTLGDGDAAQPEMGQYSISGAVMDDDETEYRYPAPQKLDASITGERWLKGRAVYLVDRNVTVNLGATLTLSPGAVVKFASGCSLTVRGSLDAQGTRAEPVVFTSDKDDSRGGDTNGDGDRTVPQPGDWAKIVVSDGGAAHFEHSLVHYASRGTGTADAILVDNGTVAFCNSELAFGQMYAVGVESGHFYATNSVIRDFYCAIRHWANDAFVNCVFNDCSRLANNDGQTLRNCIVTGVTEAWDWSNGSGVAYDHCVLWNAPGAGLQTPPPRFAGTNGNLWADPLFVDPDNGDFRIAANSPCVDAGDGTVAPPVDFYGRPRMNARRTKGAGIPDADGLIPDIGICEVEGLTTVPVADLAVLSVDAPMAAVPGDELAVTYVVTNRGNAEAVGTVRDRLMLKGAETAVGGAEVALAEMVQSYLLEPGASATFSMRTTCPAAREGTWRVGVAVNAERDVFEQNLSDNVGWAAETTAIELPTLASGETPVLVGSGAATGFLLGEGVRVLRVRANATSDVVVYGANGTVPQAAAGGVAAVTLGDGSWLLVLPERGDDEKAYVVIENAGSESVEVHVVAEAETLSLDDVAPNLVAVADGVSVTLTGTGLGQATSVTLGGRPATRVMKVNEAQTVATFDLSGLAAGPSAVEVRVDDVSSSHSVEVCKTTIGPQLKTSLELPSGIRDGRVYAASVVYANIGDEPMQLPFFKVVAGEPTTTLSLSPDMTDQQGTVLVGGISPIAPAGTLKPGDEARIPVYFTALDSYTLRLEVVTDDPFDGAYGEFGGAAGYLAAAERAATRLNLRGRRTYDGEAFYGQAYRELHELPHAAVSGRLLDEATREPLGSVELSIVSSNGVAGTLTTAADGYFQFDCLADGDYFFMPSADVLLSQSTTNDFSVVGQEDLNDVTVLASVGGRVSGVVCAADGLPLAGNGVTLCDESGRQLKTAETGANGLYSFDGLLNRTYLVRCASTGGAYAAAATNVVIDAVTRAQRVDFTLIPGAVVRGTVRCEGVPVSAGTVLLQPEDGTMPVCVPCSTNGEYCADGVAAGRYDVRFVSPQAESEAQALVLAVGDDMTVDISCVKRPLFIPLRAFGFNKLETRFMFLDRNAMSNVVSWAWDFDNDGQVDSDQPDPTWTYTSVGTNTVVLKFRDADGVETVSRYPDCCVVMKEIESVVREGAVVFGKNEGTLEVVSEEDGQLVLKGEPASGSLVAGSAVLARKDDEWYLRRILAASREGDTWTLTVEPGSLPDVYSQYGLAFCSNVAFEMEDEDEGEADSGREKQFVANAKAESNRPKLLASADTGVSALLRADGDPSGDGPSGGGPGGDGPGGGPEGDSDNNKKKERLAKLAMGFTGDLTFPNDMTYEFVDITWNGRRYERQALSGNFSLNANLGLKVRGVISKNVEKKKDLPWTIPTPVAGVTAGAAANLYWNAEACLYGAGMLESQYAINVFSKGFTRENNGKKKEFNVVSSGAMKTDYGIDFGGYAELRGGVKLLVKAKVFGCLAEAGVGFDAYLNAKCEVSTKKATTAELGFGVDGVIEASALDDSLTKLWKPESLKEFLAYELKGAVSFPLIYRPLIRWTGPEPDFEWSPNPAPLRGNIAFLDCSKPDRIARMKDLFSTNIEESVAIREYRWEFGTNVVLGLRNPLLWVNETMPRKLPVALNVQGVLPVASKFLWARKQVPLGDNMDDEYRRLHSKTNNVMSGQTAKSCDPNEMVGPDGTGPKRFVRPGEWMDYTVYFENKAGAGIADAQEVRVTSSLSSYLDWSTFELGEVAFNNQVDLGLVGCQNGTSETALRGTDRTVRSVASLDLSRGEATWYLRIVAPDAPLGWPTDGSGFLPSNDETHRGEGHVTYRVKVREDAPDNVRIDASASIVFDYNDPITTDPAWWNTVGQVKKIVAIVDGVEREFEVVEGEAFGELPDPGTPPENCVFDGWYTKPGGNGYRISSLATVEPEIEAIYAHWLPYVAEMDGIKYTSLADAVKGCPYNASETNEIKLLSDFEWKDGRTYEYIDEEDESWPAELAELNANGRWASETVVFYKHKMYLLNYSKEHKMVVSSRDSDWTFFTGQKVSVDLNGHLSSNVWLQVDCAEVVIRDTSEAKTGAVELLGGNLDLNNGTLTLESGKLIAQPNEYRDTAVVQVLGDTARFDFLGGEIVSREGCAAVYVSNGCIRVGGAAVATNAGCNVVLDLDASLELVAPLTGRIGITTDNDVEGAVIGWNGDGHEGAENFYCDSDSALRGRTTEEGEIVWERVGQLEKSVGRHLKLDLVEELGLEIPEDVDFAKGDKVTVKVEGLAKGLKVVATPVYKDPKAKKKVIVDYVYTIEGVPTEAVDFDAQTMYARVTVTYKDKTKGVKGKVESLQPLALSITTQEPTVLTDGLLNQAYAPADIAALWPAVADAAIHPKEWSFKGWPAGVKYNATTKPVTAKQRIDGVSVTVTNALPYEVYGKPTKAGDFTITATHAWKIDGKSVKETFTATMRVWADGEMTVWNGQAYVATTNDLTAAFGAVKSASGLPTGLKFTAKAVNDKAYGALAANTVYGKPTKAGTFVVTLTLPDPADAKKTVKTSFLWKIAPATAPTFALDTGSAPVADRKAQIVQGANQSFAITATPGAKVTASGLPAGLKLVQDKTTKLYTVQGVASKPGEYRVTFKTALNGVTTVTTTAFTVKGNPFAATYRGSVCARPDVGMPRRLAVAEVSVAAAGTVKLTYTEGKTKYTASVKSFDWDDATGKGTAEGLVLKVSSADKKFGYGNRTATVTLKDLGTYLMAELAIADADGFSLMPENADLYATVKETGNVVLPASQTFVFWTEDGADTNALATVSVAYDAKKATAAFSGKLYDGTAVKATVPVLRRDDEGEADDSAFAPFLLIAKDGTVYCFDGFSTSGGSVDWVCEDGETVESARSASAEYTFADAKFAELVPETGAFTFGWGSDAEIVGLGEESFLFAVTRDKNGRLAGVAISDADPQPGEKPLATVTAKVGKATGAISVSFTSKKGDRAKYAVELVWRSEQLFAGHVTRTWKASEIVGGKPKQVSRAAYGTAIVK